MRNHRVNLKNKLRRCGVKPVIPLYDGYVIPEINTKEANYIAKAKYDIGLVSGLQEIVLRLSNGSTFYDVWCSALDSNTLNVIGVVAEPFSDVIDKVVYPIVHFSPYEIPIPPLIELRIQALCEEFKIACQFSEPKDVYLSDNAAIIIVGSIIHSGNDITRFLFNIKKTNPMYHQSSLYGVQMKRLTVAHSCMLVVDPLVEKVARGWSFSSAISRKLHELYPNEEEPTFQLECKLRGYKPVMDLPEVKTARRSGLAPFLVLNEVWQIHPKTVFSV